MKFSDAHSFRRILARNVTLPLVIGLVSSAVFVGLILHQISVSNSADHSNYVLARTNRIEKLMIDAETGLRGFVITGKDSFLEPHNNAVIMMPERLKELRDLVSDNPQQVRRVDDINVKFQAWLNYSKSVRNEVVKNRREASNVISQGHGKAIMDEIRSIFDSLVQAEEGLRSSRSKDAEETARLVLTIVIALSLFSSIFLALSGRKQLVLLSETYEESIALQLKQNEILKRDQWLKSSQAELSEKMVGEQKLFPLCDAILSFLAAITKAKVGTIFVANNDMELTRSGGFGYVSQSNSKDSFKLGEGLVGQAARDARIFFIENPEADELRITSSLVEAVPRYLMVIPIKFEGAVSAVIELGFLQEPDEQSKTLISNVNDAIGVAIKSAKYRERLEILLKEVQNQSEELQAQQEELRVNNEELEEQTRLLKEAQTRMEAQHAELEQTNAQLEEQSRALEIQKESLNEKNVELMAVQENLEVKAEELARASRYKSEFLANMSHELRTPLNSSLILAKLLSDNKDKNLTDQQVEFAKQIQSSGQDLLILINDILDLSKVESGKLEIVPSEFEVDALLGNLERTFKPIAREKHLEFQIKKDQDAPEWLYSDIHRIEQIVKNLLSNAFKFTSAGSVTLEFKKDVQGVRFVVNDTGIGIAPTQLDVIFEAFRQADGTTSRKFGGTGLGLSISRNLARMLGGNIDVASTPSKGSQFSLVLPEKYQAGKSNPILDQVLASRAALTVKKKEKPKKIEVKEESFIPDDRKDISDKDRCILIIEDDKQFAQILAGLTREMNFKCVVTDMAEEGLQLAEHFKPDAVVLDINLPDHSGLMVLDRLKQQSGTRHIPVHVISAHDFAQQAYQLGAVGYIMKPVKQDELMSTFKKLQDRMNQNVKKVLIIEDDEVQRKAITSLIADESMKIIAVSLGEEAIAQLSKNDFDCVIMDLNLPDMSGFDLLEKVSRDDKLSQAPIIIYTGRDLSADEEARLKRHSSSVIIKGAKSPERLLDEVTLFLHQVESKLTPERQKMLESLRHRDRILENKKILIVDDDMRNVFALTSALEQKGAKILMARNGEEALKSLSDGSKVDLVLMDIMMPIMDGYEAMRRIRALPEHKKLPIIALTAKAMRDDREKCLEAGANDYLTKPVDLEKLLSLIRVWMS